jgi:biopolymer transport protein TolR
MNLSSSVGRRSRRGQRRTPMAEINVTPLVDVMLVLLIIFMVTAPLLVSGVPVELPESRAKPLEQKTAPLDISIDKEGQIFLNSEPVTFPALVDKLQLIAAQQNPKSPTPIMLRGDTEIAYGQMMRVMGELNRAGLNNVNLVTKGSSGAE